LDRNRELEIEELIEMTGIHLQNQHNVSPLAGRIWASIIIEGKDKGLTFDYLVEKHHASKSSISTNLNLLLSSENIYFTTIQGDRKKYFRAFPFSVRFERLIKNMEFEKKLLDKIIQYKNKEPNTSENECSLQNIKAYKNHLDEMEILTQKLMDDLKKIEKENQKSTIK
jgi:DNA-binding transcriptional regulator GbsR (MarR family)